MQVGTARQSRPRAARRLVAVAAAVAALGAIPFAGSAAAATDGLVPGTPCHYGTTACVQLGHAGYNARSWFIRDDRVVRGPVSAATGGPGKDTPTGTFPVTSKDIDHVSSETTNAEGAPSEMPYSVFFGNSGYAFHGGGNPRARTAGCIRMANTNASYWYRNLSNGDRVEIVSSSARSSRSGGNDNHRGRDGGRGGGLLGGL